MTTNRPGYMARWRAEHHDELRIKDAAYYAQHRDERVRYQTEYNRANAEDRAEKERIWRRAHPHEARSRDWKKRGIHMTVVEYRALVAIQDGRCAICGDGAKLNVDHDHATGVVRGLLCNKCNWGLGMFRDNPDLLEAAIRYLQDRP